MLVPAAEKWDVSSLREDAEKVDACLVEIVEKEGPWNPVAKSALIESGPGVSADVLNMVGIGADRADAAAFITAAVCILVGRSTVASKLEKLMAEKLEREKKEKKEPDAHAHN